MDLKYELQRIISGVSQDTTGDIIKAATHYLGKGKATSRASKELKLSKEQETTQLIEWIEKCGLWFEGVDENRFIARGAEQRVYLDADVNYVIKLNDSIFYAQWLDYFHSLLIHNFLFSQTAYQLIGFQLDKNKLHAVVRQPYIEITEPTDTRRVGEFLQANGFQLKKNNDYFNSDASIILEDLHDENVLTNQGVLFFIDTTFYLMSDFF